MTTLDQPIRPFVSTLQPGAYSAIDATALTQGALQSSPIVAILGACTGGAPNTPLYFRGPGPLKQVCRSGPAYDAARMAFSAGAAQVCVVRGVGTGSLKASKTLAGATLFPVTLTAIDTGAWCNAIQVAVAANNVVTITYTDPFGVITTEKYDCGVSATAQNVVDAINGVSYGFAKSNLVVASTPGTGTMPLTVAGAANLTAGADGAALDASSWTAALAALEPEEVSILVPATGDATVHAQVKTHCDAMSVPLARRERTCVLGGVAGEAVATAAARLSSLRGPRVQHVYPGITDYNSAGVLTTYDPFYAAAKVAGMHAALADPAFSLTHKTFPCVGVETILSTIPGGGLDTALVAGLTPIAPKPGGGYWIVDSLATYNTDDTFRDFNKIRSADFIASSARSRLEAAYVGSKNLFGSQKSIAASATSLLRELQDSEIIRAFQAPIVSQGLTPTAYNVSLPVMLVDTTKFIYITLALQPSSTLNRDFGYTGADAAA